MEWFESDQNYVKAAIEQLRPYLSSQVVFWPLSQSATPLTIGNLLFSLRRLSVYLPAASLYTNGKKQFDEFRTGNRGLIQQKEKAELKARIREWAASKDEWEEGLPTLASLTSDLRNRTIIELLLADLDLGILDEAQGLEDADRNFTEQTEPGDFVWSQEFKPIFQQEEFWFLWRKPTGRING